MDAINLRDADMEDKHLVFRTHAVKRMFERSITVDDVDCALEHGEVIENYPDDFPFPSRLILGWTDSRPLHIVVAENTAGDEIIVVTVYEPNLDQWNADMKGRKQ